MKKMKDRKNCPAQAGDFNRARRYAAHALLCLLLAFSVLTALFPAPVEAWYTPETGSTVPRVPADKRGFLKPVSQKKEVPEGFTAIASAEDMWLLTDDPEGSYIFMNDVDISENTSLLGALNETGFYGVLDGNGYSLNMGECIYTYTGEESFGAGLFSYADYASIRNLYLSGSIVISMELEWYGTVLGNIFDVLEDVFCGGLIALAGDGVIVENCVSAVDISFESEMMSTVAMSYEMCVYETTDTLLLAGGLVGCLVNDDACTVSYCRNLGNVTGFIMTGGICGLDAGEDTTFLACENFGNIRSLSFYAGGICGYAASSTHFLSCMNAGTILADNAAGGIVGVAGDYAEGERTYISTCLNTGNVTANAENLGEFAEFYFSDLAAGGITGAFDAQIEECLNLGLVKAGEQTGAGIAGSTSYPGQVKNCLSGGLCRSIVFDEGRDRTRLSAGSGFVTDQDLTVKETFPVFTFASTNWTMSSKEGHPYPSLLLNMGWIRYSDAAQENDLMALKGNTEKENAIQEIMSQYEFTEDELKGIIMCFAEGYGAYPSGADGVHQRSSALCVVWKNQEIVYTLDTCSTFPDHPGDVSKNGRPVPTIKDGLLSFASCQHNDSKKNMGYPALKIRSYRKNPDYNSRVDKYDDSPWSAPAVRIDGSSFTVDEYSASCNIHMKYSETLSSKNDTWANSTGCTVLGGAHKGDYNLNQKKYEGDSYARFAVILGFGSDSNGDGYADNIRPHTAPLTTSGVMVINRAYGYEHVPAFHDWFNQVYSQCPDAIPYILQ